MTWTAIIPFKGRAPHKTRLSVTMSADARRLFAQCCLLHVDGALRRASVARIVLLSDQPPACWPGEVATDRGRGLNVELDALAATLDDGPLIVIHADLPLLHSRDIEHLVAATGDGVAIAPDRHGVGTNAVASWHRAPFPFAFGAGSLTRHRAAAGPAAREVCTLGLGFDVATPCDIVELLDMRPGHRTLPAQA